MQNNKKKYIYWNQSTSLPLHVNIDSTLHSNSHFVQKWKKKHTHTHTSCHVEFRQRERQESQESKRRKVQNNFFIVYYRKRVHGCTSIGFGAPNLINYYNFSLFTKIHWAGYHLHLILTIIIFFFWPPFFLDHNQF